MVDAGFIKSPFSKSTSSHWAPNASLGLRAHKTMNTHAANAVLVRAAALSCPKIFS